ncbi:MAG: DUF547 domain-containing protein [Gammaproteobacteria bacterium]|nr:DUF547 domain-containing protein [Gammaproteobacteria bacterium]MDH5262852.1 DUF547 domain-containing protein [Gammaproteobacteria bacterium]
MMMIKSSNTFALALFGILATAGLVHAAESTVPEPFRGYDENSNYTINYDDLSAVLRAVVVDVGRSTREVAQQSEAKTGTRMKAKVKRLTANEGNRFYYETVEDSEESQQFLRDIQKSLEEVPDIAPLENFSRDEQLAYWLNLYNVTLLNQIIDIYPKRDLKKVLNGKNSILSKKLLTVAGIPLSLDDIQFTILRQNYDNNPLIMYGLYQGVVGGPNIRKSAYTGADVYRALQNNAYDFVNSNRGTYGQDERTFRVSTLYDRNRDYFPNFKEDLSAHLMTFIEGYERIELERASSIKPDIYDWTVTDLGGTHQQIGGSFADSRAALLDSYQSTTPDPNNPGKLLAATVGAGSSSAAAKGKTLARFDQELLVKLHKIDDARRLENERNASVTIEDVEDSPAEPAPSTEE